MKTGQVFSKNGKLSEFPNLKCGLYPTPLQELIRLRAILPANCPRLFIKRDDYTGIGFGGNKVRKLDFAIAQEKAKDINTIITIGGEKSNHVRVTTAICANLGLKCVLVLHKAPASSIPPGLNSSTRFICESLGAEIYWVETREEREPKAFEILKNLNEAGQKAAFIPLGASIPIGGLGYVNALAEVKEQFESLKIQPDYIFHAGTSGGTQAGLVAGCQLYGWEKSKVIAVSPDDSVSEIVPRVVKIVNGIYQLLEVSGKTISADEISVLDKYVGDGYGFETELSREAFKVLAKTEGIILDPAYTAKAMAALLDFIREGKSNAEETILFWHTGGQMTWFYTH